jgi:cystathionine beta-lyase
MRRDTTLVHFDAAPGDPCRPNSTPIYQTATFEQPNASEFGAYDYSRSGNPTRAVLESQLARLEGGSRAFAFGSGMAALSTLMRLVPAGGHVVAGSDLYGGTYRLLEKVLPRAGLRTTYVDATDPERVRAAIEPSTRLVLVETPTNPLCRIVDLRALAEIARERGALLAVDNSLLSPLLQRPLELGADVVVHSATKHLGGHGDVTAGVLAVRVAAVADEIAFLQNAEGNALGPFDSWLLLRGIETLSVRLGRAQANARTVARFLARHPAVRRVHFPGLTDHPGRAIHERQAEGPGAVVSFETGSAELSRRVVDALEVFTISVSFGSVKSLASLPCRMSHKSIPAAVRQAHALPDDLVRLSIGIEDERDLVQDLAQALGGQRCRTPSREFDAPDGVLSRKGV